jgi:adenylate cyclase
LTSAWARRLAVAGLVGVAAGWFTLTDVGGWAHRAGLDYLFDLRNRFAGPTYRAEESPVAVIVIDEETYRTPPLAGLPQVAWTPQLGRILSALAGTEAKEVGLDLVYSTTLDGIEKLRGYDQELLRGMFRLGRPGRLVLGAIDLRGAHIGPHPGQVQAAGGTGNVRILNLLYD